MYHNSKIISIAEITTILLKHELLIEHINIDPLVKYSGIKTDTRNITVGQVFVCIIGCVNDGLLNTRSDP
jgi:UDP-N-acetylmuramyl pentapeptide synthase